MPASRSLAVLMDPLETIHPYGRPEPAIEAVPGAPAIKSAMLSVTVDYETSAPLS
jgi:hypothetical protein